MLTWLSGAKRLLVGRLVALIYLICVLAPSSALAIGNGRLSEHCLFDDRPVTSIAYRSIAHQESADADAALRRASHHDHSSHSAAALHPHQHDRAISVAAGSDVPEPTQHQHQTVDLQCCGMLCIAALPAAISDVAKPSPTHAFALPETGRHLADSVPKLRYRPPIA